jgi:hypothetical protein
MWLRNHYTIVQAGKKARMSRAGAYRAAERGLIPTIEDEGFLWVPKEVWDRQLARMLSKPQHRSSKSIEAR